MLQDAIDKLVEKKLVEFTCETANRADLARDLIEKTLKSRTNTEHFIQIESEKYADVNEFNSLEEKERAELDADENEIDVENISDKEDCYQDDQRNTLLVSCTKRSSSPSGSVESDSSSKSIEQYARNMVGEEKVKLSRSEVVQPPEVCKAAHRQRFNVNLQKQNTQSVIINGKRYYRKLT